MKWEGFAPILLVSFQSLTHSLLNMKAHVIVSALSVNLRKIGKSFIIQFLQNIILKLIHICHLVDLTNNRFFSIYVVSDINLAKRPLSNFMLDLKLVQQEDMFTHPAIWTLFALNLQFFLFWLYSLNSFLIFFLHPLLWFLSYIIYEILPFF